MEEGSERLDPLGAFTVFREGGSAMTLIGQQHRPREALRIAQVPGADDYWFDWFPSEPRELILEHRPTKRRMEMCRGVPSQRDAMSIISIFVMGLHAAAFDRTSTIVKELKENSNGQA